MSELLRVPVAQPYRKTDTYDKSPAALLANPWVYFGVTFAWTWVYNNTSRSILAVILFHGMVNFTGELFDIPERANTISIGLWVIAAIGITLVWGPKRFTGRSVQTAPPTAEG